MNETLKGHIYVLLATVLIAGSFSASAILTAKIDSIVLTLYRFIAALVILSPFVLLHKTRFKETLSLIPSGTVVGFLYGLYFTLMFESLKYTTILNTASIYTLIPLITAIFCIYFCREKISFALLSVYIIGIISTLIIIFRGDIDLLRNISLNRGDFIFFIASISMALYPVAVKFLYKKADILSMVTSTLLGGSIWIIFYIIFADISITREHFGSSEIVAMSYLVIATTIMTLFLYQKAIMILGPKRVMAYIYLNPAIVVIIIYLLDGIKISLTTAVGVAISTIATFVILNRKY